MGARKSLCLRKGRGEDGGAYGIVGPAAKLPHIALREA